MSASNTQYFLDIVEQPKALFYNAHGGKKSGLTVRAALFSKNLTTGATQLCRRIGCAAIPLDARLVYTSGLPASSLKTDEQLLNIIESRPIGTDGEGRIKFRLEEVSNMHKNKGGDSGRFQVQLSVSAEFLPNVAVQTTQPFVVKSKKPRRKRKSLACNGASRKRRSRSSSLSSDDGSDDSVDVADQRPGFVSLPAHVLASMEWISNGSGPAQCPCCRMAAPVHAHGCALHAALHPRAAAADVEDDSDVSDSDSDDSSLDCDTTAIEDEATGSFTALPLDTPTRVRQSNKPCTFGDDDMLASPIPHVADCSTDDDGCWMVGGLMESHFGQIGNMNVDDFDELDFLPKASPALALDDDHHEAFNTGSIFNDALNFDFQATAVF